MPTWLVEYTMWFLPLVVPPIVLVVVLSLVVAIRRRLMGRLQVLWGWIGPASPWQGAGRVWSGVVEGRNVVVRWFEHNTTVEVGARPKAEVAFTRKGQPASVATHDEDATPVDLPGKVGYAPDPSAARALASAPGVDEALGTLLGDRDRSLRAVRVDPKGTVSWFARNLPERALTPDDAHAWVRALMVVARASEAV